MDDKLTIAILKALKDLKIYIDNYVENMDYECMASIGKKDIDKITANEFKKLDIKPSSYHKITYISPDELENLGFEGNPNDDLQLNKDAIFFKFEDLPFFFSSFILEFYNNTCNLTKGDIEKVTLTTGNDLIKEIYEHLSIETYKEELNKYIAEYQLKVL